MVVRAVFLDRDGVLNANVVGDGRQVAPSRLEDFRLLDGASDAVRALKAAGFVTIVVTNQPDLSTGRTSAAVMAEMHAQLRRHMPLDDIRVCPHVDADGCDCRKPKPGMIVEAARHHGIALGESFLVGDRWRDIGAGAAAGCATILVGDNDEAFPRNLVPDHRAASLYDAAKVILQRDKDGVGHDITERR